MTRNCLNVMQKYASMDKEAGKYDKLFTRLMSRFPAWGMDKVKNVADRLYGRKLSTAMIRREAGRVSRAANRLRLIDQGVKPGAGRQTMADRITVSGARFNPNDWKQTARNFNKEFNPASLDSQISLGQVSDARLIGRYAVKNRGFMNRLRNGDYSFHYGPYRTPFKSDFRIPTSSNYVLLPWREKLEGLWVSPRVPVLARPMHVNNSRSAVYPSFEDLPEGLGYAYLD